MVPVAHPDVEPCGPVGGDTCKQIGVVVDGQDRRAVFPARGPVDLAAELVCDELKSVADPEDRDAERKDAGDETGAPSSYALWGLPESMIPFGLSDRIRSRGIVQG